MLAVIMILIINITIFVGQKQNDNEDRGKVTDVSQRHSLVQWVLLLKTGWCLTCIALKCPVLLASQTIMALPLIHSSPEWVKNESELCAEDLLRKGTKLDRRQVM